MKVKFLASVLIQGEHVEQNEVVDLDDELAKEMIKIGRAAKYNPNEDKTPSEGELTAKDVFAKLNLTFAQGKEMLKTKFDFNVQGNATIIPAEIAEQLQ